MSTSSSTQRRILSEQNFAQTCKYIENFCKENPAKFVNDNKSDIVATLLKRLGRNYTVADIVLALNIVSPRVEEYFLRKAFEEAIN